MDTAPITTKEDVQALATLTLKLVRDRNMPQRELLKIIRTTLTDAAKGLPRIPVLYNAQHGGFGLSGYFKKYAEQQGHGDEANGQDFGYYNMEARTALARLVPEFGEHVAQQYPYLTDLVATYRRSNARQVLRLARDLDWKLKTLEDINENLKGLDERLAYSANWSSLQVAGAGKPKPKPDQSCLRSRFPGWYDYDINDLQAFRASLDLDAVKSKEVQAVEKITSSEPWQSLPTEVADAVKTHMQESRESMYRADRKVFIEAVQEVGPECPSIWRQQQFFCSDALSFLARAKRLEFSPAVYAYFAAQQCNGVGDDAGFQVDLHADRVQHEDAGEEWEEWAAKPSSSMRVTMGLLAASSTYCRLGIAHAPPFVECGVGEYDGLESINML